MSSALPIRAFDPDDDLTVVERRDLPHWCQAGTLTFITWRTWDSIPRPVMAAWLRTRAQWLSTHGIDVGDPRWRSHVARLPLPVQREFRRLIAERWEDSLNECHGDCALREPKLAQIVADSLQHFDYQRYVLTDFVVMPNHVHVLAAFSTDDAMLAQCDSWKHYTAVQLNRQLARRGHFWEVDGFDHLIRSEEHFEHFRRYIADNPKKARLQPGEFVHYTRNGMG